MAVSFIDQIISPPTTAWKGAFPSGKIQGKRIRSKSSTQLYFPGSSNLGRQLFVAGMEHHLTCCPVETDTHSLPKTQFIGGLHSFHFFSLSLSFSVYLSLSLWNKTSRFSLVSWNINPTSLLFTEIPQLAVQKMYDWLNIFRYLLQGNHLGILPF